MLAADRAAGRPPPAEALVERLLLVYEELTSNAVRHGHPPVRAQLACHAGTWILLVTDGAPHRPPEQVTGRDPAHGGLGATLVARLASAHGWWAVDGHKVVWATVDGARPALR